MRYFLLLCSLFLAAHAADDGSDLSYNQMMQHLRKAETANQFSGESKFVYGGQREVSVVDDPLPQDWQGHYEYPLCYIRKAMQAQGALKEVDYFREIAAGPLSDEEKISKPLVLTHFFDKVLRTKNQLEKDNVLKQLAQHIPDRDYPVTRLLVAASVYVGANANVFEGRFSDLLRRALSKDDISLISMLLKEGAHLNQEGNAMLALSKSIETAELMIAHGANVAQASWEGKDLISDKLTEARITKEKNNILRFYLQQIPLDKSNDFGCSLMRRVSEKYVPLEIEVNLLIETVEILLEYQCKYTDEIKTNICKKIEDCSPESKAKIEHVFKEHEIGGKNIKPAKRS